MRTDVQDAEAPKPGYFKRHWRGENSLGFAYWVNGVLMTNGLGIALGAVFRAAELSLSDPAIAGDSAAVGEDAGALLLMLLIIVVLLAQVTWALVGIWRSATRSIERAKAAQPPRSAFWAYAAKLSIVAGIAVSLLQIAVAT